MSCTLTVEMAILDTAQNSQLLNNPKLVRPDEGPKFDAPLEVMTLKLSSRETGGQFALMDIRSEPGAGPPYHVHTHEDELFSIHEGQVEFTINGETIVAGPGDRVYGPRNVPHTYRTLTDAHFEVLSTGTNFEEFLPKFFEAAVGSDMPRAMEIASEHGIHFVPPA